MQTGLQQGSRSPLYMVPGALLGAGTLVAILVVAYKTWYEHSMPLDEGLAFISVLACVYAIAAYLFSFGYHGGDYEEALKLTGLILLCTVLAVIIIAALFAAFGSKNRSTSGSSSSSKSRSTYAKARRGWHVSLHVRGQTGVEAGPAPAPVVPQPVGCPSCNRSYVPEQSNFTCPGCGAPASRRSGVVAGGQPCPKTGRP